MDLDRHRRSGCLVALMALIGAFVARDQPRTSTISLRQSPDSVWKVVRDFGGAPAWFSAMEKSERLPTGTALRSGTRR